MVRTIAELIGSPLIAFVVGVFLLGLARKVTARIQRRYGPPIYQPVIDVVKLLYQKSVSHGLMFDFGILLSLGGAIVTILFVPVGRICPLNMSGGMLVIIYLMLLSPLGTALSAGEAANPNASIGISRKMLLALGYEVPFLLIILAVMTHYGTTSISEIVHLQQVGHWGIVSLPLPAIAALLVLPPMLGIKPFDLVGAPQEIASGPLAEYGGKYLALISIQHAFHTFLVGALFVDLFLGGAGNLLLFLMEVTLIFFLVLLVSAVYPRFRIEQALRYCWKWPTILAFIGLIMVMVGR